MELLTRHRQFETRPGRVADEAPIALSARVVQVLAISIAVAVGIIAWATPGIGAAATLVVGVALAVAATAQWRSPV